MAALAAALLVAASSAVPTQRPDAASLRLRASHEALLADAQARPAEAFRSWAQRHAKSYLDDAEELGLRFKAWMDNLQHVLQHNARGGSFWLHMGPMADLTAEEYSSRLGFDHSARLAARASNALRTGNTGKFRYADLDEDALPPAIDWRAKNAVSEVKDQVRCWARVDVAPRDDGAGLGWVVGRCCCTGGRGRGRASPCLPLPQ